MGNGKGWLGLAASITCSTTHLSPNFEILGEFGAIFRLSGQILSVQKLEPRCHPDINWSLPSGLLTYIRGSWYQLRVGMRQGNLCNVFRCQIFILLPLTGSITPFWIGQ